MVRTGAELANGINPVRKALLITLSKIDEGLILLGGILNE